MNFILYLKGGGGANGMAGSISGGGMAGGGGSFGGGGGGCMVPADIAFLFDGSNLGDKKEQYFQRYLAFAKQVVDYHPPSIEGYHYGAVLYSDNGVMQFDFEKYVLVFYYYNISSGIHRNSRCV